MLNLPDTIQVITNQGQGGFSSSYSSFLLEMVSSSAGSDYLKSVLTPEQLSLFQEGAFSINIGQNSATGYPSLSFSDSSTFSLDAFFAGQEKQSVSFATGGRKPQAQTRYYFAEYTIPSSTSEILGSNSSDTLVGGAGSDKIEGLLAADLLTGGLGKDAFVQRNGDSVYSLGGWRLEDYVDTRIVNNKSYVNFGDGVDIVTDFNSANDVIDADAAGATDAFSIENPYNAQVGNYYVRGTWDGTTKYFTANTAGLDVLFYVHSYPFAGDQTQTVWFGDSSIVLQGGALNFDPIKNIV